MQLLYSVSELFDTSFLLDFRRIFYFHISRFRKNYRGTCVIMTQLRFNHIFYLHAIGKNKSIKWNGFLFLRVT